MSFKIKDRRKMTLFRECVKLLTSEKEEFYIHFAKTHVSIIWLSILIFFYL